MTATALVCVDCELTLAGCGGHRDDVDEPRCAPIGAREEMVSTRASTKKAALLREAADHLARWKLARANAPEPDWSGGRLITFSEHLALVAEAPASEYHESITLPLHPKKPARPARPAPVLEDLPRITKGKHKGERWMNKAQFAAWCGVTVGTVNDWLYTGRIRRDDVEKDGTAQQSRIRIASGARERKGPPVVRKKKAG